MQSNTDGPVNIPRRSPSNQIYLPTNISHVKTCDHSSATKLGYVLTICKKADCGSPAGLKTSLNSARGAVEFSSATRDANTMKKCTMAQMSGTSWGPTVTKKCNVIGKKEATSFVSELWHCMCILMAQLWPRRGVSQVSGDVPNPPMTRFVNSRFGNKIIRSQKACGKKVATEKAVWIGSGEISMATLRVLPGFPPQAAVDRIVDVTSAIPIKSLASNDNERCVDTTGFAVKCPR